MPPAVGAVLGGISAGIGIISGIKDLASGEGDDRPPLGGPDTLTGSLGQKLTRAYTSPSANKPSSLPEIRSRIQAIGQRLGLSPQQ